MATTAFLLLRNLYFKGDERKQVGIEFPQFIKRRSLATHHSSQILARLCLCIMEHQLPYGSSIHHTYNSLFGFSSLFILAEFQIFERVSLFSNSKAKYFVIHCTILKWQRFFQSHTMQHANAYHQGWCLMEVLWSPRGEVYDP